MTPQRLHVEPLPEFQEGGDIVQVDYSNERIKQILVGSILGDGHLRPCNGAVHRSCLEIKGDDKNFSYLEWLRSELLSFEPSELKPKKGYHQHYFRTKRTEFIGELRMLFYPDGIKIIPAEIKSLLITSLALAVWYQDDGTLDCRSKYHYNAAFATHCFSFENCQLLTETLAENFGLDVRVIKCTMRGKLRYKLHVTSRSMAHFIQLVEPHINPCFAYKVRKLT